MSAKWSGWHRIKHNETTRHPASFLAFDTETRSEAAPGRPKVMVHRLAQWQAVAWRLEGETVTRREWGQGEDQASFWAFLVKRLDSRRPLWAFAHNLGFDLTILDYWNRLLRGEFQLDLGAHFTPRGELVEGKRRKRAWAVLEDPPTLIWTRHQSGRWVHFVDSYNWFPRSLEWIGRQLGLSKLTMPDNASDPREMAAYCRRDVEIVELAVAKTIGLVVEHDLGTYKGTAAGQAYQGWRHRFMPPGGVFIHRDPRALALEEQCHYGGRVQCFFLGPVTKTSRDKIPSGEHSPGGKGARERGPVYHLDVNSLYAAVMADERFPRRLLRVREGLTMKQLGDELACYHVQALVLLKSLNNDYPVRTSRGVRWARGLVLTAICGAELVRAFEECEVLECFRAAVYDQADLFGAWVAHWWEQRQKAQARGDLALDLFAKTMLVALYGKFVQKSPHWEFQPGLVSPAPWGVWTRHDQETKKTTVYRSIAHYTQLERPNRAEGQPAVLGPSWRELEDQESKRWSRDAFPAIGAAVTAAGRVWMDHLKQTAGNDQVLYQSTDSLHVLAEGYRRLVDAGQVDGLELGKLRLEATYDSAAYLGPNNLRLGGRLVVAGLKRQARQLPDGSFEQEDFERLGRVLGRTPNATIEVATVPFTRPEAAELERVTASGWVRPHRSLGAADWVLGRCGFSPGRLDQWPALQKGLEELAALEIGNPGTDAPCGEDSGVPF